MCKCEVHGTAAEEEPDREKPLTPQERIQKANNERYDRIWSIAESFWTSVFVGIMLVLFTVHLDGEASGRGDPRAWEQWKLEFRRILEHGFVLASSFIMVIGFSLILHVMECSDCQCTCPDHVIENGDGEKH